MTANQVFFMIRKGDGDKELYFVAFDFTMTTVNAVLINKFVEIKPASVFIGAGTMI